MKKLFAVLTIIMMVSCTKTNLWNHPATIAVQDVYSSNIVVNEIRLNGEVICGQLLPSSVFSDSTHILSGTLQFTVSGGGDGNGIFAKDQPIIVPAGSDHAVYTVQINDPKFFHVIIGK